MALGYQGRREQPPITIAGSLQKTNDKSFFAKLDGVVTPIWLPKSMVDFYPDGNTDANNRPTGRFSIPGWLARKEGLN